MITGLLSKNLIKAVFGTLLLVALVLFVSKHGIIIQNIQLGSLLVLALIVLLVMSANAVALLCTIRILSKSLSFKNAFALTAITTFGNSIGGLPFGTAYKVYHLTKVVNVNLRAVVLMMLGVAALQVCFIASVTFIIYLDVESEVFLIFGVLLVVSGVAICIAVKLLKQLVKRGIIQLAASPMLPLISCVLATIVCVFFFFCCFFYVAVTYLPDLGFREIAVLSGIGLSTSIVSGVQSIGGMQELAFGFAAFLSDLKATTGIEFALLFRVASIFSSGFVTISLMLVDRQFAKELWSGIGTKEL